jgi:hypothetical protein
LLVNIQKAFYQLVIAEKNRLGAWKIVDFTEQLKFLLAPDLSIFTYSALHHLRRQSLNGSTIVLSISLFLESNTDLSLLSVRSLR